MNNKDIQLLAEQYEAMRGNNSQPEIVRVTSATQSEIDAIISVEGREIEVTCELEEWVEVGNHEEPWTGSYVSAEPVDGKQVVIYAGFFGHPDYNMDYAGYAEAEWGDEVQVSEEVGEDEPMYGPIAFSDLFPPGKEIDVNPEAIPDMVEALRAAKQVLEPFVSNGTTKQITAYRIVVDALEDAGDEITYND